MTLTPGNPIYDILHNQKPLITYLESFAIYAPDYAALRSFRHDGSIAPLGIDGEGLMQLLALYTQTDSPHLKKIKLMMQLLGWFDDFHVSADGGGRFDIRDRFVNKMHFLDQRSVNQGFFFLLFYCTLFCSDLTPPFFAIDNIDAGINPKTCEKLMLELVKLTKRRDKQVVLTTHSPSILDGMNLDDDEQRLFVVSRDANGATKIARVKKTQTADGVRPPRLSELFLSGMLGGLPEHA